MTMIHPLVGVTSCTKDVEGHQSYATPIKYLLPVHDLGHAMPVLIPALGDRMDIDTVLDRLDGILLTGSLSNSS